MTAIAKGGYNGPNNPAIVVYVTSGGVLADAYSIEYQIFDVHDDDHVMSPTQVLPTIAGQRATVNLVASRMSVGKYSPAFVLPISAATGRHMIRWFVRATVDDVERIWDTDFDVLPAVPRVIGGYALLADLREEGVTSAMVSDARLMSAIEGASKQVEAWTRQWFEPRACTFRLDNDGTHAMRFGVPIITLEGGSDSWLGAFDLAELTVYNRHISQGLLKPDDRRNPKIEWSERAVTWGHRWFGQTRGFEPGNQNIEVAGLFGFTEADGSFVGKTPDAIRHVVQLLALRRVTKLGDVESRFDALNRYRIKRERTRDQEYELGPGRAESRAGGGMFTGDPEIDDIILDHMAPIDIGSTSNRFHVRRDATFTWWGV